MQPKSHEFVIRAAVARPPHSWLCAQLEELLRGHRDEDDWVLFGLRLRAPGLTHTYRPGHRYGELGAPSARTRLFECALRARQAAADAQCAYWLGRACHLLGDMAVPARTRGVWHLLGDPLEAFWEAHAAELDSMLGDAEPLVPGDAALHADALALASSAYPADTTRTPWGALSFRYRGKGQRLKPAVIEAQARVLLPLAVAHTSAFLRGEAERRLARGA